MKPTTARIYGGTATNLARLATLLRKGELVAVPTETVYGLAANALDARACGKIFTAKGRPKGDPLIVHIHRLAELAQVAEPNPAALKLAAKFWPGPLTMVLPKKPCVPAIVSAGRPSVAVRMPSHPLFRRLLRLARLPLAAPSANPFGYISPTTAGHVRHGLGTKIRHILDGGPSHIGLESTIIDLRDPRKPRLLRPGAITRTALERALGQKISAAPPKPPAAESGEAQIAPGLLARHYSPRTPLKLHDRMPAVRAQDEAWIFLAKPAGRITSNLFWLDDAGDLTGVARRLFATLRNADQGHFKRLHAERPKGSGLAEAINDRLRRAAAR